MNPKDFYNRTVDVYDLRHDSPPTRLVRKKEKFLIKKFASGKILDFGCGTGRFLREGVVGIDISGKMLEIAGKKSTLLIKSDENIPLKSDSVDTIFCFLTVLNMVDTKKVQKEFFRILKPAGRILLSVASIFDHYGKKEKTVKVQGCKMKLKLYTLEELKRIFGKFNLEYFDSLFIRVKPEWGNFRPFSPMERMHMVFEHFLPKERGGMYFLVFKK